MKKVLSMLLILCLLAVMLTGCTGKTEKKEEGKKPEKIYLTIVTGSTGGTYYPVGTILASLWNEKLADVGINASAQSSGGSVENLNMLKAKEAQLAIAMSNLTLFSYEGKERFKDNRFEDVRFITALWPDVTQFVVTKDSGINTFADIRGKRFAVGGAGSGTEYSTRIILKEVAGLTYDDFQPEHLGYFEAATAMQNGQLAGMNAEGGIPTAAVSELYASKTPVKMLEFSDEDFTKVHRVAPYYMKVIIPSGTYTKQDKEIYTIGVKSVLIGRADLDEELVYNLLKVMYDNLDEIKKSHKALEYLNLGRAVEGLPPVPLHPGAVKFYKEKGIDIPGHLLP